METKTFAQDGSQIIGDSRTYVDGFGKTLQNQVKVLSAGRVLATQPLYGKYDQAVGSSLAAPIASTDFAYTPNFISPTSATSAPYDYTRFDDGTKVNSPEAVSSATANTLGWYYSANNTVEPYTAITGFPYARTDAMADGSTGVSRSVGPGANLQLGSGHERVQGSFPVRSELDAYAGIRNSLFTTAAVGGQVTSLQQAAVQSLSTDADGTSTLVFADKSGHPTMSARPATAADAWMTASNTVEVGWPYSVQIQNSSPLITLLQFASTADIMAFDNQGKWLITGSADQVAQKIGSSGNIQNYLFYSTDSFTVINDPGTGAAPATYASQAREAYPFFNFYIVGDGSATVTSKPATPNSSYTIINTLTGNPVSLNSTSPLPPGCYQLQIITGAVSLAYTNRYKDISFNFYNQKGKLIESIAPKGVQQLLQSWSSGGAISQPAYVTTFEYDQQGRQLAMNEADAGRTIFVYRADGRLRFSQNAKQAQNNTFSYIGYDEIGRQVEFGEGQAASAVISDNSYLESTQYGGSGFPGYFTRTNIVRITYDTPSPARDAQQAPNTDHNVAGYTATFLSGRVSTIVKYSSGSPYGGYSGKLVSQTWFSYDELGRVTWQIQQTAGQPARTVDYTYSASGPVATVCYQKNVPSERLTHYYFYDADNRLTLVRTNNFDPAASYSFGAEHASYSYYLTGQLKRVVYGSNLQGVDYTYTAAGQLKSINNGDLTRDPGKDGTFFTFGDFWGTTLNYYQTDYASAAVPGQTTYMTSGSDYAQHYNGLVSGISWQTPNTPLNAFGYNYDYKSQLQKAAYGILSKSTTATTQQYAFNADPYRYQEGGLDYDSNGNIGHLQRSDGMGASTLAATYQYKSGTNQLTQIFNANNPLVAYTYDAVGQVIAQEEQPAGPTSAKYFDYDSNGKVTALFANSNRTQVIARYTYDEYGKRLIQQVYPNPQDQSYYVTTTFVRDMAGHELASYVATTTPAVTNPTALLYEQPIYGATRLGILRQARDQTPTEQLYELNDQLGNTRIVFRRPTTTTYALSMEDARVSQEQQDFPAPTAATYNATRSADYAYGYSSYNAGSGTHYSIKLGGGTGQGQSPTKIIPAQRGDSFHLTAYATYIGAAVVSSNAVPSPKTSFLAAGMLGIQPRNMPYQARETQQAALPSWQQALSQLSIGVGIPLGLSTKSQQNTLAQSAATNATASTPPNAYLQLLVRKASDNSYIRTATVPVPSSADGNWQQLTVDLTVTESFPVLVEVSARGDANLATYFDDLTVQYTLGPIVEENHYYAYGQRLDGLSWRRTDERLYGRGYQGQNTTQDAESGFTAFDLRMYDARYGRWLMNDPMRQHASGYVGMGNNPVSRTDSNGGFDWYKPVGGGDVVHLDQTGDFDPKHYEYIGGEDYVFSGGWLDDVSVTHHSIINEGGLSHAEVVGMSNFSDLGAKTFVGLATAPIHIAAAAELGTGFVLAKAIGSGIGQWGGAAGNWREIDIADIAFDSTIGNPVANGAADALLDIKPAYYGSKLPIIASPLLGNKGLGTTLVEFGVYSGTAWSRGSGIDHFSGNAVMTTVTSATAGVVGNGIANTFNTAIH
jgi:RHS repeat-associated protein